MINVEISLNFDLNKYEANQIMTTTAIVIHTSCQTSEEAQKISDALLAQKLAACIQHSNIQSQYFWGNKLESNHEVKLEIKTSAKLFDEASKCIKRLSSYDCPEIIATPIIYADDAYLNWLQSTVQS